MLTVAISAPRPGCRGGPFNSPGEDINGMAHGPRRMAPDMGHLIMPNAPLPTAPMPMSAP